MICAEIEPSPSKKPAIYDNSKGDNRFNLRRLVVVIVYFMSPFGAARPQRDDTFI